MSKTNPLTTTRKKFEEKISAGTSRMHCDFAFYVGGTHHNMSEFPAPETRRDGAGVKVFVGSDYSPHAREEKNAYLNDHSGMTGIRTLVPTMLVHVNSVGLSLERFVDITSHEPNRLFGVARIGHMAVGYDADLNFGDLKCRESIRNGRIASRAGRTPDDGATVTGWTVGTIERGHRVV